MQEENICLLKAKLPCMCLSEYCVSKHKHCISSVLLPSWLFLKNAHFDFVPRLKKLDMLAFSLLHLYSSAIILWAKSRFSSLFSFHLSNYFSYFWALISQLAPKVATLPVNLAQFWGLGHGHTTASQSSSRAWGAVELRCVERWVCSATTGKHLSCKAEPALPEQPPHFSQIRGSSSLRGSQRFPGFCCRWSTQWLVAVMQ